jgi:hypothetical protein
MPEVPHFGHHHGESAFGGDGDDEVVVDEAARLGDGGGAGLDGDQAVREGEDRLGRDCLASCALLAFQPRHHRSARSAPVKTGVRPRRSDGIELIDDEPLV